MRPSHGPSLPKAHLYMLLQTLIISGSFPVVSSITPGTDSTLLAFWRFLAATYVFFLMLAATRSLRVPGWRDMGRYSVVGGSYAGFFILMFESLKFTSPINTSTIYTTLPLTTLVMAGMLGEPIRLRQVGILGLSMVATLWVIFRGNIHLLLTLEFSRGDLIFALGTLFLAVYLLSMKFLQRDESRMQFTFYSLLVGTVLLLAAALWRTGSLDFPGPGTWLGLAYLAILSTAVTFWLLQLAAPVLGPNRVVAYTFLTPSLVLALQWLIGSKPIEPAVLPGIAITLVTVWLLQRVAGQRPTTIQTDL